MAVSLKYGRLEIPGVPADEPVFVLRAQDVAVPSTLTAYHHQARRCGATPEQLVEVGRAHSTITSWQYANPGRVKVPD